VQNTDVLIVGGSAAGITAAITARKHYPEAEITLIRKEEKVLIPCGIPYIVGTLESPEEDLIPDTVLSNNNVDIIIDEVTSINKGAKIVSTAGGRTIKYKKMILTTGALPVVPPISGVDLDNVFVVKKEIAYLKNLLKALDEARDVVIIGGGFVGLEFADECRKRGNLNVTVIELLPHCLLLACDEEVCTLVEEKLQERGINILTGRRAKALIGNGKVQYVELENGQKIKADVVILGIGVAPNIELARKAGLEVIEGGGICVDEFMRTSDKDIFAAGDCTQKRCFFTGKSSFLRLASIATMEARVAGANLFRLQRRGEGSVGVFGTVIGDLAIGSAGMTERSAKEAGFNVVAGMAKAPDKHPASIPGTKELGVKLVFEKETGILLGGQVWGGVTTGLMTNFIGALIQKKMRADEIVVFQVGTHPMLTASPIAYQIQNVRV